MCFNNKVGQFSFVPIVSSLSGFILYDDPSEATASFSYVIKINVQLATQVRTFSTHVL